MRNLWIYLLFWLPFPALACFSGIGYEQNWNESIGLLWLSVSLCTLAVLLRLIRKAAKLYIPVFFLLFSCIPSALEIARYGSGDCGSNLIEVSMWPIYSMLVVGIYEMAFLVKYKFGVGNT